MNNGGLTLLMDAITFLGPVGPINPDTSAWRRRMPQAVSTDPAQLQAWHRSGKHLAYAVRTGTKAVAWDIEVEHLDLVRDVLGTFTGPLARSARGGVHLWTLPLKRTSSNLYADDVHIGELKANGAACTVPPSVKPKGSYRWERGPWEVAPAEPGPLLLALLPVEQPRAPVRAPRSSREAMDGLEALAYTLAHGEPGNRNRLLYWCACRAIEAGIAEPVAVRVFARAGADVGMGVDEVRRTVASAAKAVTP